MLYVNLMLLLARNCFCNTCNMAYRIVSTDVIRQSDVAGQHGLVCRQLVCLYATHPHQ